MFQSGYVWKDGTPWQNYWTDVHCRIHVFFDLTSNGTCAWSSYVPFQWVSWSYFNWSRWRIKFAPTNLQQWNASAVTDLATLSPVWKVTGWHIGQCLLLHACRIVMVIAIIWDLFVQFCLCPCVSFGVSLCFSMICGLCVCFCVPVCVCVRSQQWYQVKGNGQGARLLDRPGVS